MKQIESILLLSLPLLGRFYINKKNVYDILYDGYIEYVENPKQNDKRENLIGISHENPQNPPQNMNGKLMQLLLFFLSFLSISKSLQYI